MADEDRDRQEGEEEGEGEEQSRYSERFGSTPVTELHNELSEDLDGTLSPARFLRVLRAADAQIFGGWGSLPGCMDPPLTAAAAAVSARMHDLLLLSEQGKQVAIALTGCGTSGRVAYLLAVHLNRLLAARGQRPAFHYLISGGDSAVLFSDELPEDDPITGAADVQQLLCSHGADGILLVGVTCGLSAPYVAGQLDLLLRLKRQASRPAVVAIAVMGFNPVWLGRDAPIEKFEDRRSFRGVLRELQSLRAAGDTDCFILNPVVSNARLKQCLTC
jgi:hypothetical protein